MSPTRISLAIGIIAASLSAGALAAPTQLDFIGKGSVATYKTSGGVTLPGVTTSANGGVSSTNVQTWGTAASAYCINGASGCAAGGGTNYGNSYSWTAGQIGGPTSVTMTAWGTATAAATSAFQDAYIGNYGTSNGYGVTGQQTATGELKGSTGNMTPDASSPDYQHALDNFGSYEALMFAFGSSVALNTVSIGFPDTTTPDTDATVLVWTRATDPASISGQSYTDLLANGWALAGNLANMTSGGPNTFTNTSATQSSKYWLIGAYAAIGGNQASQYDAQGRQLTTGNDAFKVTGLGVTSLVTGQAIPEPDSVALFGIAALGLVLAGRRKARKA